MPTPVALTAYGLPDDVRNAAAAGFTEHRGKRADPLRLAVVLEASHTRRPPRQAPGTAG